MEQSPPLSWFTPRVGLSPLASTGYPASTTVASRPLTDTKSFRTTFSLNAYTGFWSGGCMAAKVRGIMALRMHSLGSRNCRPRWDIRPCRSQIRQVVFQAMPGAAPPGCGDTLMSTLLAPACCRGTDRVRVGTPSTWRCRRASGFLMAWGKRRLERTTAAPIHSTTRRGAS